MRENSHRASRATGVVTLLLFTAVLVLGLLVTSKGRLPGLPGFAVTSLHRNLSLLGLGFVVAHVLTAVLDGYVSIPLVSAVIPFASGHERFWLGLGTVALDLIIAIILTGRGGAAFPAYRKLAIVAAARGPKIVVANGAESEPASRKDETLIRAAPHLILDGLQLAAETVGASEAYLYLHQGAGGGIGRALRERAASGQDLIVTLADTPPRFLAGQESAVVNRLGGGPAIPVFTPPRVTEHGLGGQPTLVQNVETLAHLALIARYGPRWFRALGTPAEPGSMLATCYPASGGWRVTEAAIGTPLATLLGPGEEVQAWLVGGYHGSWLAPDARLALDNGSLRALGAAVGAGVLAALPADRCGVAETARVASYLAAESAGQCGPCLNGLPRIAATLAELSGPWPRQDARDDVERWAALVNRRGPCSHPDGTVRFVRSAWQVFEPEFRLHQRGRCSAVNRWPFLPLPGGLPTNEDDWN